MPLTKAEQDKINLCGSHTFTQEERSRGGQNSALTRRRQRDIKALAELINTSRPSKKTVKLIEETAGEIDVDDNQMAFAVAVLRNALSGDAKAMKLWLEMSSESRAEKERLEIEKLRAEVEALKAASAEATDTPVSINIEIKDCKR